MAEKRGADEANGKLTVAVLVYSTANGLIYVVYDSLGDSPMRVVGI